MPNGMDKSIHVCEDVFAVNDPIREKTMMHDRGADSVPPNNRSIPSGDHHTCNIIDTTTLGVLSFGAHGVSELCINVVDTCIKGRESSPARCDRVISPSWLPLHLPCVSSGDH